MRGAGRASEAAAEGLVDTEAEAEAEAVKAGRVLFWACSEFGTRSVAEGGGGSGGLFCAGLDMNKAGYFYDRWLCIRRTARRESGRWRAGLDRLWSVSINYIGTTGSQIVGRGRRRTPRRVRACMDEEDETTHVRIYGQRGFVRMADGESMRPSVEGGIRV